MYIFAYRSYIIATFEDSFSAGWYSMYIICRRKQCGASVTKSLDRLSTIVYAKIFISVPSPRDLNEVTPSGGRRARKP